MHGELFLDGYDNAVVEHALKRHIDIHDLWQHLLEQRQKDALCRLGEKAVLHGRLSDDCGRVDGILAVRDRCDVKNGVIIRKRIVACVIAEGALSAHLVCIDIAFEDDLCRRRHLKINGDTFHEFDRFMAQKSRKDHFINVARQRRCRRIGHNRIRTDGNRSLDALSAAFLHITEILRAILVDMPMHPRRAAVILLQTIHPDIALARRGILGKDERQCHKRTAVIRPTF